MTDILRSTGRLVVLLLYNSGLLMNNAFVQRPVAPMLLYLCFVPVLWGINPFLRLETVCKGMKLK